MSRSFCTIFDPRIKSKKKFETFPKDRKDSNPQKKKKNKKVLDGCLLFFLEVYFGPHLVLFVFEVLNLFDFLKEVRIAENRH